MGIKKELNMSYLSSVLGKEITDFCSFFIPLAFKKVPLFLFVVHPNLIQLSAIWHRDINKNLNFIFYQKIPLKNWITRLAVI